MLTTRSYTFIQQDSFAAKLVSINVIQQLILGGFLASLLDVKHLFNKILLFINGPTSRKNQHDKNSQRKVSSLFGFNHNLIFLNNNLLNHMRDLLEQLLFSCTDKRSIGTSASRSNVFQVIHLNDEANLIPNLCMTLRCKPTHSGGLMLTSVFSARQI